MSILEFDASLHSILVIMEKHASYLD